MTAGQDETRVCDDNSHMLDVRADESGNLYINLGSTEEHPPTVGQRVECDSTTCIDQEELTNVYRQENSANEQVDEQQVEEWEQEVFDP